jgi:methionyl-tRNA formyltransferase
VWSGDKQTGVSLMFMTKELDAGNIIYQQAIPIDDKETYHSLYIKLAQLSYRVLIDKIHSLFTSHVPSQPQDIQFVTIAKNITRENEKINWNNSNLQIERQIRGLFDKPIAYTTYINFDVKIYEATCLDLQTETHPGTIVQISKNGMDVACGNHQILKITKLQLPGKKPIYLKDMVNGHHPFKVNHQFNS